jgi:predicted metal-binding membrane protein
LAVLSSAGVSLSMTNYWPIINGSYTDYVGGMSLTPVGGVISVSDRWNNSNSSFETASSSYAQAPAGNYFRGTSFSLTMWIKIAFTQSHAPLMDFANGADNNNIFLSTNTNPRLWMSVFSGGVNTDTAHALPFPVGSWMHLAVTYDGNSLTGKIYINSNLTVSAGGQYQFQNVTRLYNYFGCNNYAQYGDVLYDEMKFHSRVLTAQEVLNDMINNQSYISLV